MDGFGPKLFQRMSMDCGNDWILYLFFFLIYIFKLHHHHCQWCHPVLFHGSWWCHCWKFSPVPLFSLTEGTNHRFVQQQEKPHPAVHRNSHFLQLHFKAHDGGSDKTHRAWSSRPQGPEILDYFFGKLGRFQAFSGRNQSQHLHFAFVVFIFSCKMFLRLAII